MQQDQATKITKIRVWECRNSFCGGPSFVNGIHLPSKQRTNPTLGKGKSSSKVPPSKSGKWRFIGSPTKHVQILVVTAIGRWPHPTDMLVSRRVYNCFIISKETLSKLRKSREFLHRLGLHNCHASGHRAKEVPFRHVDPGFAGIRDIHRRYNRGSTLFTINRNTKYLNE